MTDDAIVEQLTQRIAEGKTEFSVCFADWLQFSRVALRLAEFGIYIGADGEVRVDKGKGEA